MAIDDEQATDATMVSPVADFLDDRDQRDGLQRYGAGPPAAMTERAAVGECGKHRDARPICNLPTKLVCQNEVHPRAEMRSVLFRRSDGENCRAVGVRQVAWQFVPGSFRP